MKTRKPKQSTPPLRLGTTVKTLREERGWSQGQLAELCSSSPSNISKVERGDERGYSIDLLEALAAAFEIEVYELFALAAGVDLLDKEKLTLEERDLLDNFRALTSAQKEMLHTVSATLRRPKTR